MTYFCPALDPPLDRSGRKTTTLVRDLEYFIHTKFHQNPSRGSGEEVENVNSLTDDRRRTDAGLRVITIGHWSLWLLCPKNDKPCYIVYSNSSSAIDQSNLLICRVDDIREITRHYNTACHYFYFYSNYDQTWNNFVEKNIVMENRSAAVVCVLGNTNTHRVCWLNREK